MKNSLKHLSIESCNKIDNYNVIGSLKELVFLALNKMKMVSSLDFINHLKNLKSFVFVESNVIDGNMTPTLNLQENAVIPIKKHFHKIVNGKKIKVSDVDFSFGNRIKGDEEIELWRRTDY